MPEFPNMDGKDIRDFQDLAMHVQEQTKFLQNNISNNDAKSKKDDKLSKSDNFGTIDNTQEHDYQKIMKEMEESVR